MHDMKTRLSLAALLILLANPAFALEFNQVQTGESKVAFGYKQMGVSLDGKFDKFSAQLSFDPAKLSKASAKIDIDISSIDTGSIEADEEVVGKQWFDTRTYPVASFVATGIKSLGGNRYEASGKLSIKGKTLEVTAPVTFQSAGNRGQFEGAFNIRRLDYAIGEGVWADTDTVANEIQIKFHLVVTASPSKK